jgi:predicted TIM-barrel fold metal-dependent hydrolase
MIVDTHVHIWEPDHSRFTWQPLGSLRPDFAWTTEDQVGAMAAAGIERAVLIQTSWYGYNNAYMLDAARRYPGKFALVGMVDPSAGDLETQMQQCVAQGISGFRLMPRMRQDIDWYNKKLWGVANELALVLTLLVTPEQVIAAEPMIAGHPHVSVVIDHLARPDQESPPGGPHYRRLLGMARHDNLYLKMSALAAISLQPYPHADAQDWAHQALEAFGAHRLMWGSDFAMSKDLISMRGELDIAIGVLAETAPADRELVLGGTAARLWKLEQENQVEGSRGGEA